MRIGRQVRDFSNRFLSDPIHLIRSIQHKRTFENVQMPMASVPVLDNHLKDSYSALCQKTMTSRVQREVSKVLGKFSKHNACNSDSRYLS